MVTRRGYLGSTGGFADGFTSGFGLMNQAYTDKRKLDAEIEELEYRRGIDAEQSDYRRLDREEDARQFDVTEARLADSAKADAQFRTDEAKRQAEEARLTAEFRSDQLGLAGKEAEAQQTLREAQLSAATVKERDAQESIDLRAQEARELDAQNAIAQMDQVIKTAQRTGIQPDLAVISALLKRTENTKFDLTVALGTDYQNNIANLTDTLSVQLNNGQFDGSDPRVEMGADALVNAQGGRMIGKIIDDSFVNAPPELQNGDYKVISREAVDIQVNEQAMPRSSEGVEQKGPPQLMVGMDVLVTAEGPDGKIAHYIAPMTEGRAGGDSKRVQVPATDMFDGLGGNAVLINYLNENMAEPIKAARKEDLGGEAGFQTAFNAQQEAIIRMIDLDPDGRTYMSDKTNEELQPEDILRIAEDRALGLGSKQGTFREEAKREIMQTKADLGPLLKDYRVADKNGDPTAMPRLSNAEILRISATLGKNGGPTAKTRELLREILKRKGAVEIGGANRRSGSSGISPALTARLPRP